MTTELALDQTEIEMFEAISDLPIALLRGTLDGRSVAIIVTTYIDGEDIILAPMAVLVDAEMLDRLSVDGEPPVIGGALIGEPS